MLCDKCYGSGEVMGPGMIFRDCGCDNGRIPEPVKAPRINRRSKEYKDAISNIMEASECSREEAVKEFETEFYKIA